MVQEVQKLLNKLPPLPLQLFFGTKTVPALSGFGISTIERLLLYFWQIALLVKGIVTYNRFLADLVLGD